LPASRVLIFGSVMRYRQGLLEAQKNAKRSPKEALKNYQTNSESVNHWRMSAARSWSTPAHGNEPRRDRSAAQRHRDRRAAERRSHRMAPRRAADRRLRRAGSRARLPRVQDQSCKLQLSSQHIYSLKISRKT